jgi:hypothetical protein
MNATEEQKFRVLLEKFIDKKNEACEATKEMRAIATEIDDYISDLDISLDDIEEGIGLIKHGLDTICGQ